MKVDHTVRGFERIDFKDAYGEECSLQQSSVMGTCPTPGGSFVWLGINSSVVTTEAGITSAPSRMHLNRNQVFELIQHLTHWHETGSFKGKT